MENHRLTLSSARNQFSGHVVSLAKGPVNTEVVLDIGGLASMAAIVTNASVAALDLGLGSEALALVKASWVIISADTSLKTSARNQIRGKVKAICRGAVNSEVVLEGQGGLQVASIITNASLDDLALLEGQEALALFKASQVILAVR